MLAPIIAWAYAQAEDLESDIIRTGSELVEVVETLMGKLENMDWDADDREAYNELQSMWNSEDFNLQEILQTVGRQVGVASQSSQSTVVQNAAMF